MAFPYVAIKLLESPLRDELMPLKYVSVSCPLMVIRLGWPVKLGTKVLV